MSKAKDVLQEFWGAWVVKRSDFTADDMKAIKREDSKGPRQLAHFGSQLGDNVVMPPEALVIEVFEAVLGEMHVYHGKRLEGLKAKTKFDVNVGKLDWSKLGTALVCDPTTGKLKELKHIAGGTIAVDPDSGITKNYKVDLNWSDTDAQVRLPPQKARKLWDFYKSDKLQGPGSKVYYKGSSEGFNEKVTEHYNKFVAKQTGTVASVQESMKKDFDSVDKAARKLKMQATRVKAAAALAASRSKREVAIG